MLTLTKYAALAIVAILSLTAFVAKASSVYHEIFNAVAAPAALALFFYDSKIKYYNVLFISIATIIFKDLLQLFIWDIRTQGQDGLAHPITILFLCIETIVFLLLSFSFRLISRTTPRKK